MIEYEQCGRYKHADDIEEYTVCESKLCENCYQ